MKLLLLLLATLAAVQASWLNGGQTFVFDEALDVPGKNPLQHCEDPKDDVLDLQSVDLDPNPPQA